MELSILGKLSLILKYFTSSFLGIEIFLIVFLLFIFLLLNIKKNNYLIKIIVPIIFLSILIFISGGFHNYVVNSIDEFIKILMNYYYFPSMAVYYIIILFMSLILVYTILSDNISKIKRIINYIFCLVIYLCFLGLISFVISNKIALTLNNNIYKYDLVLSFVQVSNLLLLVWFIITIFWYLYKYLKRKFDK